MFRMDFKVGKVDTDLWERRITKGENLRPTVTKRNCYAIYVCA